MENLIQVITNFGVLFLLLGLGYWSGTRVERKHLKDLSEREKTYAHIMCSDTKTLPPDREPSNGQLVVGQVVIASDFFKTFVATLRNLVGGEVKSFETLLYRARKEATLRMLEQAHQMGANVVCNIRYETSNVGRATGRAGRAMAEILAYGTAFTLEKGDPRSSGIGDG